MRFGAILSVGLVGGMLCSATAHDFWVDGANKEKFKAHIGYGHGFPSPEAIPAERMELFNAPYIVDKSGKKELKQVGENYQFEGDKLAKGSYILAGEYKPTIITRDKDNKRHMGLTKDKVKDATSCRLISLTAKKPISVDGVKEDFIYKPIGQKIEIVPLSDLNEIVANKPFKVQVFLDGKPLKRAKIMGLVEGFVKSGYAFYSTANLEGVVEVMALKSGKWILKVSHEQPFSDEKLCDEERYVATLMLDIR